MFWICGEKNGSWLAARFVIVAKNNILFSAPLIWSSVSLLGQIILANHFYYKYYIVLPRKNLNWISIVANWNAYLHIIVLPGEQFLETQPLKRVMHLFGGDYTLTRMEPYSSAARLLGDQAERSHLKLPAKGGARRVLWAKQSFPPSHPVMRSSPDVKVRIPAAAGRSCTGAPRDPCSLQSGAATLGLVGSKVSAGFEVLIYRKEGQVSVSEGLWWPLKNGKRMQLTSMKFQEPNAPASPGALNSSCQPATNPQPSHSSDHPLWPSHLSWKHDPAVNFFCSQSSAQPITSQSCKQGLHNSVMCISGPFGRHLPRTPKALVFSCNFQKTCHFCKVARISATCQKMCHFH